MSVYRVVLDVDNKNLGYLLDAINEFGVNLISVTQSQTVASAGSAQRKPKTKGKGGHKAHTHWSPEEDDRLVAVMSEATDYADMIRLRKRMAQELGRSQDAIGARHRMLREQGQERA